MNPSRHVEPARPLPEAQSSPDERPYRFRPGWPRICRLATIVTWLLTSVLFGLLHSSYGAYNVAAATVNGLIWGMVAIRARSIIPALIGHGTYNAIIFALQTL